MEKLRLKLRAYDNRVLDKSVSAIIDAVKRTGSELIDQSRYQQKSENILFLDLLTSIKTRESNSKSEFTQDL